MCGDGAPNFVGRFPALFHIIVEHEPQVQRFYAELRTRGVLMHPFDCQILTAAHTETDVDFALAAAAEAWAIAREAHPGHPGPSGLSREALDFRTLHEIGGTVRFRDPLSEIPRTWEQADR